MTSRVFETSGKVGRDEKVNVSMVIYDHHLTGESERADVQVSITACINGVQPSFTFYVENPQQLVEIAEKIMSAARALQCEAKAVL